SRRRHTRFSRDWSSDVCSSDLKTSSYRFSYSNDVLPLRMFVSVNVVNANISEVMHKIFEGYPLQWKIYKKNNVVISPISPEAIRSEEHTSELQSRENLVCRLRL